MMNFNEPETQAVSDNFLMPETKQDGLSPQSEWGELSGNDVSYLQKKGMQSPADLLHSYRELEKAYSSRVALPKDGDEKGLQKLYSHLGMPDKSDDFKLSFDEKDEPFIVTFKEECLKNNIL